MSTSPELVVIPSQVPSGAEQIVEQTREHPYDEYWKSIVDLCGGPISTVEGSVAQRNQQQLEQFEAKLTSSIHEVGNSGRNATDKVAQEWYLKLGSFNQLKDAGSPLTVAFVRLWESASGRKTPSPDINKVFYDAATEIHSTRNGTGTSESIREMSRDAERASSAVLAGNIMLDYVRSVPGVDRTDTQKQFLGLTYQLNSELLRSASGNNDQLGSKANRVVSDALKFKYEAAFDLLATEKERGKLNDDTYQVKFNTLLGQQLKEAGSLAQRGMLSNGDLHEHYFLALIRYGKTSWQDETRYLVQGATRRQDEPHDSFAHHRLPLCSFDAKVIDTEGEEPDQYIQLKMPGASDMRYIDGITVIDSILSEQNSIDESLGARNYAAREEMIKGISQLQGLVHELSTDAPYRGRTDIVSNHLQKVSSKLAS